VGRGGSEESGTGYRSAALHVAMLTFMCAASASCVGAQGAAAAAGGGPQQARCVCHALGSGRVGGVRLPPCLGQQGRRSLLRRASLVLERTPGIDAHESVMHS